MMRWRMANVWVALLWFACAVAQLLTYSWALADARPEPPRAAPPLLRIEAGRHTGGILRISTDEQNRYLASVSLDKTVRIWELPALHLQSVLRPPIGTGIKGALFAVAMSPDGETIVCGGGEGEVFVFQRATGQMTHRLQGFPNIITHLAYSRDGRWLVATLGGQQGIRLYDARNYTKVDQDSSYGAASHYAEFSPDGRLITVSDDGYLRLYEPAASGSAPLKLMTKRKMEAARPRSASFSPDGNVLAVGFIDHPRVELVSAKDLAPVATLSTSRAEADQHFISVAWSSDGQSVYAAGSYQERGKTGHKRGTTLIRRWVTGAERALQDYPVSEGSIEQLLSLKNGSIVFATHDPALGTIDVTGARTQFLSRPIADFRGMGDKFQVSDDAAIVRFAYDRGESFAEFSLPTRSLVDDHSANVPLNGPFRGDSGFSLFGGNKDLRVENWQDGPSPKLNEQPISLPPGEISRSLAVAPDREHFLLGTESKLRYFARDGTSQWRVSVPGIVWNVNIAKNGRVAVAALGDGTIRWYRLQDGQELLAFFPHTDRKRWIIWTPKGYFDANESAEELIGWHVNREPGREAEFYDASHFYEQFYHPELVVRVLKTVEPDTAALQYFGQTEKINLSVGFKRPPTVTLIVVPPAQPDRDEIDVTVKAEDQEGGIGEIRLYHNDKLVAATNRGIAVTGDVVSSKVNTLTFHVRLVQGDNELRAVALSADRIEGKPAEVRIPFKGVDKQPVLHLVVVGINQYQNSALNLNFAQPDAAAVLKFFSSVAPKLFRTVNVIQLLNSGATRSAVFSTLQSLKSTAPEDVVIVYLAGHGESAGSNWYFLPHDVVYPERPEELQKKGLSSQEIRDLVMQIGAKKVLLLMDACKSGFALQAFSSRGVDERQALAQLARANGVHVVAASNKDQFASEVQELGHGVFTYTLLEGLKGQADGSPKDGIVTVRELLAFVEASLPELSLKYRTERQYPVAESRGMDFPLALLK
ncbi:MAG: caspase family protein [Nitrospirota bacterium]|nr:caspase family protein [Nitrospirota bacterium]